MRRPESPGRRPFFGPAPPLFALSLARSKSTAGRRALYKQSAQGCRKGVDNARFAPSAEPEIRNPRSKKRVRPVPVRPHVRRLCGARALASKGPGTLHPTPLRSPLCWFCALTVPCPRRRRRARRNCPACLEPALPSGIGEYSAGFYAVVTCATLSSSHFVSSCSRQTVGPFCVGWLPAPPFWISVVCCSFWVFGLPPPGCCFCFGLRGGRHGLHSWRTVPG